MPDTIYKDYLMYKKDDSFITIYPNDGNYVAKASNGGIARIGGDGTFNITGQVGSTTITVHYKNNENAIYSKINVTVYDVTQKTLKEKYTIGDNLSVSDVINSRDTERWTIGSSLAGAVQANTITFDDAGRGEVEIQYHPVAGKTITYAKLWVTVEGDNTTRIEISPSSLTVKPDQEFTLTATAYGELKDQKIEWNEDYEKLQIVSKTKNSITLKSKGSLFADGEQSITCKVVAMSGIYEEGVASIHKDATATITIIRPTFKGVKSYSYESPIAVGELGMPKLVLDPENSYPDGGIRYVITSPSNYSKIAEISESTGMIRGIGPGKVSVKAILTHGGKEIKTGTATVTIKNNEIITEEMTLLKNDPSIHEFKPNSDQYGYEISKGGDIIYLGGNNSFGVKKDKVGEAQIRIYLKSNTEFTYKIINIKVCEPDDYTEQGLPSTVSLTNIKGFDAYTLSNKSGRTFSSDNKKVATVNTQGKIVGIGAGTTTVHVKDGKVEIATISVTVVAPSVTGSLGKMSVGSSVPRSQIISNYSAIESATGGTVIIRPNNNDTSYIESNGNTTVNLIKAASNPKNIVSALVVNGKETKLGQTSVNITK